MGKIQCLIRSALPCRRSGLDHDENPIPVRFALLLVVGALVSSVFEQGWHAREMKEVLLLIDNFSSTVVLGTHVSDAK